MSSKIGDITLLNKLGQGAFGTVFLSKKDGKNGYFATKQIDRAVADRPNFQKYFKNELMLLKSLNHPNIVHLEDVKITQKFYYIVMEYINGGSLSDCLKKYKQRNNGKSFNEEIVQYLMRQIVSAIKYIHGQKIIHRDLKLDNIMVNFSNENDKKNLNMMKATIKIIDFGFSIRLTQNNLATSILGSPINMDPAILNEMANRGKKIGKLGYDQKADIWSLGTICYELLIGEAVFNAETMNELISKVEAGTYSVPTSVSSEIVSFLNGMLQYKGEKRLSADDLYKHPFLTKNVRDFRKIDTRRVSGKINQDGLNINVKKNQTIWGIFNKNVENQLIGINTNNMYQVPLNPIPEYPYPQDTRRQNSDVNIPRNPQNMFPNKGFHRSYTTSYSDNRGPNVYGQNMYPNLGLGKPSSQDDIGYFYSPQPQFQSQEQAYSSGKGGYYDQGNQTNTSDVPTFSPDSYTFASNIYQNEPQPKAQNQGYMAPPPQINKTPSVKGYSPMDNNDKTEESNCSIQ